MVYRRRRTILLVEDDQVARFWLRSVLESHFGCNVTETDRGQDALDRIREDRPDLVVLDLLMPDMSGAETLRLVREDPEFKDLPVVVVSILDEDHELVHEARGYGIQGILRKPVNHLDLVAELAHIMSKSA